MKISHKSVPYYELNTTGMANYVGKTKDEFLKEFPKPKKDDISKFFDSSLFSSSELKEVLDFVISDLSLISKFKDNKENLNFLSFY